MERALQIAAVVIFGLIVFPVDGKARSFLSLSFFFLSMDNGQSAGF